MIETACGMPASCLGLATYPHQDPRCVHQALQSGINFFFFYGENSTIFIAALNSAIRKRRDEIIVTCGSESRDHTTLQVERQKILAVLGTDRIDIFFAEYVHPSEHQQEVFGAGGVLDEMQRWKANGWIRFVGATAHDRTLARQLATDPRVDILMHRFNMAHRKARSDVFPAALEPQTPVIAFTATRWGTLLKPHPGWPDAPPSAADCYRYCLAQPAVQLVLTAPKTIAELDQNLEVLKLPPMDEETCRYWERFGDIVYDQGGGLVHEYESQWP